MGLKLLGIVDILEIKCFFKNVQYRYCHLHV